MADQTTNPQDKVAVYFIGVDYPANIGTLSYNVRGKNYIVARNQETGGPEIGSALLADPNDVPELISKARYFDGKRNVEVFTTDEMIAASVKKAFDKGKKTPIEARMVGTGTEIVVAPSKEETIALLTDEEIKALVRQRGLDLPLNLGDSGKFAPNADASALARAAEVASQNEDAAKQLQDQEENAMTPAQRKAAKAKAEKELASKLES